MTAKKDDFWQNKQDWSRRKHLVLEYYLPPLVAKFSKVSEGKQGVRRIVIVDGFAGRGEYEDGTAGSPMLICQVADRAEQWKPPAQVSIYNIEQDPDNFTHLEQCTRPWVKKGVVTNLQGRFQQHLSAILEATSNFPMLAFLDPFKPTDLAFPDFAPLLKRPLTEILLIFHTDGIKRMLGGGHVKKETLDKAFGNNKWRQLPMHPTDQEIVQAVAQNLKRMSNCGVYAHAIRERLGSRVKYHILFLTRHPDAARLMNEAFVKEKQALLQGQQVFEPQEEIKNLLLEIGRSREKWVRRALIWEAICRRFGEFSEKQYREAIKGLLEEHPPKLIAPNVKPNRNGTYTGKLRDDTELRFQL